MPESFGRIISEARKKLGLSQKQLAARIKKENGEPLSPQYLNDIERDRRNAPAAEHLILQFARELKLSTDYLMLTAGNVPHEVRRTLTGSDPATVEKAFQAFRRQIKK
jgi:transcriptional regulator with XRE-family HTH domain